MNQPSRCLMLGIDEAGYGPNIGPLVVGCSAWIVDQSFPAAKGNKTTAEPWLEQLAPTFLPKFGNANSTHIPLGDSKALYASGKSMDGLSVGVRYWLNRIGVDQPDFQGILETFASPSVASISELPWYHPPTIDQSHTESLRRLDEWISAPLNDLADQACKKVGLQFLGLKAMVTDEKTFNREVEGWGNKASLLSHISIRLARDCLAEYAKEHLHAVDSIHIFCDKHGGRSRYQALLMEAMPELWFEALCESNARSDYHALWRDRDLQWSFLAKGDRLLGPALASMTAKWIREGLMARLNGFWRSYLPDLKPTAGYPADAKRFRREILPMATRLKLPHADWWRSR